MFGTRICWARRPFVYCRPLAEEARFKQLSGYANLSIMGFFLGLGLLSQQSSPDKKINAQAEGPDGLERPFDKTTMLFARHVLD